MNDKNQKPLSAGGQTNIQPNPSLVSPDPQSQLLNRDIVPPAVGRRADFPDNANPDAPAYGRRAEFSPGKPEGPPAFGSSQETDPKTAVNGLNNQGLNRKIGSPPRIDDNGNLSGGQTGGSRDNRFVGPPVPSGDSTTSDAPTGRITGPTGPADRLPPGTESPGNQGNLNPGDITFGGLSGGEQSNGEHTNG